MSEGQHHNSGREGLVDIVLGWTAGRYLFAYLARPTVHSLSVHDAKQRIGIFLDPPSRDAFAKALLLVVGIGVLRLSPVELLVHG